jgi:anti-anti-sigma factor
MIISAMFLNSLNKSNYIIATVSGNLDAETYKKFTNSLLAKVKEPKDILLDMSELRYISSAGLRGVLVVAKELDKKGKKFILYGLNEQVRNIFNISGFYQILPLFDNLESATQYLKDNKIFHKK